MLDGIKHCDDYIDDPEQPEALRRFLQFNRLPASCKYSYPGCEKHIDPELHQYIWRDPVPRLFADHGGVRVRVVMASRFGDLGVTWDLTKSHGYTMRLPVSELSNFGEEP